MLEPVALAVHFQDVDVVGEAVQQGPGESFRAEDLGPLVEARFGGHYDVTFWQGFGAGFLGNELGATTLGPLVIMFCQSRIWYGCCCQVPA